MKIPRDQQQEHETYREFLERETKEQLLVVFKPGWKPKPINPRELDNQVVLQQIMFG